MCGFLGSYLELRFGSSVLAAAEGCDMYFGLTAFSNSTGWCDGMAIGGWREMEGDKGIAKKRDRWQERSRRPALLSPTLRSDRHASPRSFANELWEAGRHDCEEK
jgi:hypothetical protein